MSAADKKRWAILPPPSLTSEEMHDGFSLQEALRARLTEPQTARERHSPARRAISGRVQKPGTYERQEPVSSSVMDLEPSDSERVTEVPGAEESRLETIPAPSLELEPPLEDEQP